MDAERLWQEYSTLPREARNQVVDFLAFLRSRQAKKTRQAGPQQIDWDNAPFIGMWRDRDDMTDSSQWVRDLRGREWSRNRG